MKLRLPQLLRAHLQRIHHAVRGPLWFPQGPLALLLAAGGLWLLKAQIGPAWRGQLEALLDDASSLDPSALPTLLIGGGMVTMAAGLLLRSRLAWSMALLLAATAAASTRFGSSNQGLVLFGYFVFVLVALMLAWRRFDRASVTASTLFALTSVAMLLLYATFGSYYLGRDFQPAITDLVTALYYAMVTMSTVGYGDITPQTPQTRLFTVSIIVLGVAVFATSLTAVIAPMVSRSLQRIVNRESGRMKREKHFVVIGNTPLAVNTSLELARRGRPVTRILREATEDAAMRAFDVVVGDPNSSEVLREAGAQNAEAVLAMLADDSDNAFVVLAVKELRGPARTIAAVNDARHLARVKLVQPDVVIAPQIFGGELTAMLLSGETVTPEFVTQRVFQQ